MKCILSKLLLITAFTMTTNLALASDAGTPTSPDALVKGLYPGKG